MDSNGKYQPQAPVVIQHGKLEDLLAEWIRGIPVYVGLYQNQKMTQENIAISVITAVRWFDKGVIHSYTPYMVTHNYHPYMIDQQAVEKECDAAEQTLKHLTDYLERAFGVDIRQGLVEIGCPPFASARWEVK